MRRLLTLGILVLLLACNQASVSEQAVTDLADTAQLTEIFNSAEPDTTQLILLLSPT
ncbi:MAG: hypothetical protein LC739_08340 [Actinobacteria bacterium]|nr:hypothetical protein [Actinomycetota bacterium]